MPQASTFEAMQQQADIPTDSPYAFRRYLGPFSRMYRMKYLGMNLPRRGELVYPQEVVMVPTNVMMRLPSGERTPIQILWRYCLN